MRWIEQNSNPEQPLSEARRLQDAAAELGFDWPNLAPLWDKLQEETEEFREAVTSGDQQAIEDELGDMLFMLVNFSRFLKVSPQRALDRVNRKFISRLQYVEAQLELHDLQWEQVNLEQLEAWWQAAKKA